MSEIFEIKKQYDYVIIGAGPTGLTLALYLSKQNKKILIVEKEQYIGGCHGVKRVDNLFSEHGPRIYLDNYNTFKTVLKNIGTSFNEIFTEYKFGLNNMIQEGYNNFTIREMFTLFNSFIFLGESYKNISLYEFTELNNFSEKAVNFMDRICRITDGGGIEHFTLHSFLQILNQNALYTIYQPRLPNDIGLFAIWKTKLIEQNVDILLNTNILKFNSDSNKIYSIVIENNNIIYGQNFIFAMPPYQINQLIKTTSINNAFDSINNINNINKYDFNLWSNKTNYITFIPVIFHWNTKLKLKPKWGLPSTTDWSIGHIVLSDYMNFNNSDSQTVISALITKHNKSTYLNKTPDEIPDKTIIINEVFRQLKEKLDVPPYTHALLTQNEYDYVEHKWTSIHTAFMITKYGFLNDFKSPIYSNVYQCGVQNGKSHISFTSLESSVVNAKELLNVLIPNFNFKESSLLTVRKLILIIIISIIILILFYHFIYLKNNKIINNK